MLGNPQIPKRVETFPNSKQCIMQTTRGWQVLGERVALNQTRIRMQKYRRNRCDTGINHAQRHGDR